MSIMGIDDVMAGVAAMYFEKAAMFDPSKPGADPATTSYEDRNDALLMGAAYAAAAGIPVGFRVEQCPQWPLLYVQLPTGQVSWHLPAFETPYDGHTTVQKYDRLFAWIHAVDGDVDRLVRSTPRPAEADTCEPGC